LRRRWLPMLACLNLCCRLLLIGAILFLLLRGRLSAVLLSGLKLLALSSRNEVTILLPAGAHQPLCAAPSPILFSRPFHRSTTVRYGCAIPHDGCVTSLHSQSTLLVPILSREGSGYGSSSASERASVFTACCFRVRLLKRQRTGFCLHRLLFSPSR
jgi:hypothetical protein